jgi:O-antigen polymerase
MPTVGQVCAAVPDAIAVPIVAGPAVVFLALFFVRPAWGLAFFVLARSVADAFGSWRIAPAGGVDLNLAGLLGLSVIVAGAVSLGRIPRHRRRDLRPFAPLLIAALIAAVVGLLRFGGGHLAPVAREGARLLAIPAFFAAVLALEGEADRRLVRRALCAAILLCGAWGAVEFALGYGVREGTSGVRRATGPFAYPNTLGYVLLLGINLLVAELLTSAPRTAKGWCRTRWARGALLAGLLAVLALTASFTVVALLGLSAVLFLVLHRRVAVLGIMLVLLLASSPLIVPRVAMLLRSEPGIDMEEQLPRNTLTARLVIWRALLATFRERPVVGWGLESVRLVNPVREYERNVGSDPHNDVVLFLVEGGIVGLAGFLAFHVAALGLLARQADRRRTLPDHAATTALWITYAAMMAGSLVNNLLSFTAFLLLFWGWVGVVGEGEA